MSLRLCVSALKTRPAVLHAPCEPRKALFAEEEPEPETPDLFDDSEDEDPIDTAFPIRERAAGPEEDAQTETDEAAAVETEETERETSPEEPLEAAPEEAVETDKKRCGFCGALIDADSAFCNCCGKRV